MFYKTIRRARSTPFGRWLRGVHPRLEKHESVSRHRGPSYKLVYALDNNSIPYTMVILSRRGPCPIERVDFITIDCDTDTGCVTDVTPKILSFLGPGYDFHGGSDRLTPRILGFDGTLRFFFLGEDTPHEIRYFETFEAITTKWSKP